MKLRARNGQFYPVICGRSFISLKPFGRAVLMAFILFFYNPVWAADDPVVRIQATPKTPWLGQKVVLQLDVLAADGWAQLKKTGNVEIKGGYLLRLESQGTRLNETIKGVSYTGQRYEYLFFAQQGGTVTIPEMAVDVEVKSWGANSKTVTARSMTPSLSLSVKIPPGAEQFSGVVSTTDFTAKQKWNPEMESLAVGDAIVREISLKAADVTGMAFTPLVMADVTGISIYPSQPAVEDSYNRGTLVGQRSEKITYVFEQPGDYKLTELTYTWWNTAAEMLETTSLPGLSIVVSGAPGQEQSEATARETQQYSHRAWIALMILAVVIAACVYHYRDPLREYVHSWQRAYRESERKYFKNIRAAAQEENAQMMMRATMQWLDRINTSGMPARLDQFLSNYSGTSDQEIYRKFTSEYYGDAGPGDLQKVYGVLARARAAWLKVKRRKLHAESILPEVGLPGGKEQDRY